MVVDAHPVPHQRGAVWWADLAEPSGSGPGFRRPVLIVSGDPFNTSALRTVIVVLLTSNLRLGDAPGNVRIRARETGLPRDSIANVSQLFTIDRELLTTRLGRVRPPTMMRISDGLRLALDL